VLLHVRQRGLEPVADPNDVPAEIRNLVASFQRAVVTALLQRFEQVARAERPQSLILTGGVAANSLLRREAAALALRLGLPLYVPEIALSTDNAAMIAAAGFANLARGQVGAWDLNAEAHLPLA